MPNMRFVRSERRVREHTLAHELMHVWMNDSNDGIPTAGDDSAYWFTESELSQRSPHALRDALRLLQQQPGGPTVLALLDRATHGKAGAMSQH
jgi:hypothetical protein